MDEDKRVSNPNAFPNDARNNPDLGAYSGMKLRDYFAAKALPEIMRQWSRYDVVDYKNMNQGDAENIAEQSYYLADAMLKEREK